MTVSGSRASGDGGAAGATGAPGPTGAPGDAGATGPTGSASLVSVSPEPAGGNCATGGYKLVFYVDANGNNTLDASEEATAQTAYACNGATGIAGATGGVGSTGATGGVGATGATGGVGSTGATGGVGATGATGGVGATGATGGVGATGASGAGDCSVAFAGTTTTHVSNGTGSLTCDAAHFAGTVAYTCANSTFAPAGACGCATGYTGATCSTCDTGFVAAGSSCYTGSQISLGGGGGGAASSSAIMTRRVSSNNGAVSLTPNTAGFSASGSFHVPSGVTTLTAYVLGAGGGGRGDWSSGGGGGGAAKRTFPVTPGTVISFTVGAGGIGDTGGASTDGGDTRLTFGAIALVGGGGRGDSSGGAASGGDINVSGGNQFIAGTELNGVCSAGGGGQHLDDGLIHYRVGPAGGCYPAGSGGYGPPQFGLVDMGEAYNWGNCWVHQPGGHGLSYGGGGATGGNYSGRGGDGAGGYVLFSWDASAPVYPEGVIGTAVTGTAQVDTSTWSSIASIAPRETLNGGSISYAVAFSNRASFHVHNGSAWRTVMRGIKPNARGEDAGSNELQFNSSVTYGSETWTRCAESILTACYEEAMGVAANRMSGSQLAAVSTSAWATQFVAGTLDFAMGLTAGNASSSPTVTSFGISR